MKAQKFYVVACMDGKPKYLIPNKWEQLSAWLVIPNEVKFPVRRNFSFDNKGEASTIADRVKRCALRPDSMKVVEGIDQLKRLMIGVALNG